MPAPLVFRDAREDEIEKILAMLADDFLGKQRETTAVTERHRQCFSQIDADPNQRLIVAQLDGAVVATLQLSFIPGLTYGGRWRAQIEAVRVDSAARGQGIGQAMVQWAVDQARERGCVLVQLTTDRRRDDALRFYEALGFTPSHHGMKLWLQS